MNTFSELPLSEPLQKAITELGYEKPSAIQAQALPLLLGDATDFLGLAATGTGKTAAFGLPMLERIDMDKRSVQALILCPTRELALQVAGQIDLMGRYKGVRSVAIYGGASYGDQIRGLRGGAQVVVGTPGRVIDHIEKGTLQLQNVQTLILDEADEMISMGFKEELEKILESVPREESNIWLFSATMSPGVRRVADAYLRKPKEAQINRGGEMLSQTVEQIYYGARESDKPEVLCKIIEAAEDLYGIIFCQTKSLVTDLTDYLRERGHRVDCLHGDMNQTARERTTQNFRDRKVSILVCTDVAARGLDVKDVTHVINYSIPRELDSYVHRIGRTARSGKAGLALSLVTPAQRRLIGRIEDATRSKMREGKIPSRKEVGSKKVGAFIDVFKKVERFERALDLMSDELKESLGTMPATEIVSRFLVMRFPEIFDDSSREERPRLPGAPTRQGRDDGGGRRQYGDRGDRGDRYSDRRGSYGDRGGRDYGDRGGRDYSDRGPRREYSDRRDYADRAPAPQAFAAPKRAPVAAEVSEAPKRAAAPAESSPSVERKESPAVERTERPAVVKEASDRPAFKERSERPAFKERSDRPSFKDRGDRPAFKERGDRPAFKERSERPSFKDRGPRADKAPSQRFADGTRIAHVANADGAAAAPAVDGPFTNRRKPFKKDFGAKRDFKPSFGGKGGFKGRSKDFAGGGKKFSFKKTSTFAKKSAE